MALAVGEGDPGLVWRGGWRGGNRGTLTLSPKDRVRQFPESLDWQKPWEERQVWQKFLYGVSCLSGGFDISEPRLALYSYTSG